MTQAPWQLEIFFDGACPICKREVALLRRRDTLGRLRFTDIAAPEFDAAVYDRARDRFDVRIQARSPDGAWLEGVEVFRAIYTLLGFGWLIRLTRLPGLRGLLDWAYDLFARNRHRLTGRCTDTCSPRQAL
ncbi:DUF393 domain-containing protein [Myxococcota bacterium]|nr:DUF393 domain-containing protein [Myxococcota bacterium]MBU1431129.1 DUF393 domain-containing protein [Myxococcota bacterium]MBU1899564.1 DUF393 domain-containing protein [Myxococcota bacterium]